MLKNTNILIIGVVAWFVIFVLAIAGYSIYIAVEQKAVVVAPAPIVATDKLSESQAREIAEKTCIKGGDSLSAGYYNDNSKTWWFDANLNATREGCSPACVVSEETKMAEINWRCTGLIVPSNSDLKTTGKENITQIPINTLGESATPSLISLTEYGRGSTFTVPASIQQGTEIVLKWTSDKRLLYWSDVAYICLIGLDEQKQPIKLKGGGKSCYPDIQVLIATTPLSSGEYRWSSTRYIEQFTSVPKSFQLSVRVLDTRPSEGLSEWAGLITESTSNEFTLTPETVP